MDRRAPRARAQGPRGAWLPFARRTARGGRDDDGVARPRPWPSRSTRIEAWLAARRARRATTRCAAGSTMRVPKSLDYAHLVELERPDAELPELFVGPDHERRQRARLRAHRPAHERARGRAGDRLLHLCHDRDKDSCAKGLRDAKTGARQEEPARRRARRLPARREDQRDARDAAGGRARRRAGLVASTTRCARAPVTASATTA